MLSLRKFATSALLYYGAKPSQRGFNYIVDAIEIAHKNPEAITAFTKIVYPALARKYKKSVCSIEKAMRTTIAETSYNMTNKQLVYSLISAYSCEGCRKDKCSFVSCYRNSLDMFCITDS